MYRTGPAAALICLALALASCGGGGSSTAAGDAAGGGGTVTAKTEAAGGRTAGHGGTAGRGAKAGGGARSGAGAGGGGAAGGGAQSGAEAAGGGKAKARGGKATGCEARIGDFVARMDDLRQALAAGLSYAEYVVRVRAIRAAYEAVPVGRLGAACLTGPAAAAEDAFNQYLRAANLWGECAATAGCAASDVEGRLQHRWRLASESLDTASSPAR